MNKEKKLVVAVEGKMMISNTTKDDIENSIDVQGIEVKLKGVKKDIADIGEKIRTRKGRPLTATKSMCQSFMSCIELGAKAIGLNIKNPGLLCRSSSVFGKGL